MHNNTPPGSILPILLAAQVLKWQRERYSHYYGGTSGLAAPRYEVAPSYNDGGDSPVSGRVGYSDKEVRVLAVLAGVIGVILGGGTLVSCICTRHWGFSVAACVVLALYAVALYFFFKYIRP